MPHSDTDDFQFDPLATLLAVLWPGMGHVRLGHTRRGLLIMIGVLFMFLTGILVGGVDVVDRKEDPLWFLAQAACGPIAFAADAINQGYIKPLAADPTTHQAWLQAKSLGHVHEFGTLFVALAGLMNLVVILDTLHAPPNRRLEERRRAAQA